MFVYQNYFINSVVWFDSAENFAPIWCDISTKIIVAQNMALPCCNLVISKTLESIASVSKWLQLLLTQIAHS